MVLRFIQFELRSGYVLRLAARRLRLQSFARKFQKLPGVEASFICVPNYYFSQ